MGGAGFVEEWEQRRIIVGGSFSRACAVVPVHFSKHSGEIRQSPWVIPPTPWAKLLSVTQASKVDPMDSQAMVDLALLRQPHGSLRARLEGNKTLWHWRWEVG